MKMLKRLRNRFLFLNMSMTSIVMIAAFTVVYVISYNSVQTEIKNKLETQIDTVMTIAREGLSGNIPEDASITATQYYLLPDVIQLNLETDSSDKIASIDADKDLPEAYFRAAEAVYYAGDEKAVITIENKKWRYSVTPVMKHIITGNIEVSTIIQTNKYQVLFLDVTEYMDRLSELSALLIIVCILMLFCLFFISLFYANRAIKPIAVTWEKQKRFVSDASHEFKTPVSIINANYDLLLSNQEETIKSQKKWFGYIKHGTDRMTTLINSLLDLAELEEYDYISYNTTLNVSLIIKNVISSLEAVILEKKISITYAIDPDITIKSDPEKVRQAVSILLDNAVRYTDSGGRITISFKRIKKSILFSVENTGKGIPEQDLPKVFDRFFRVDQSRRYENGNFGLGLSIAKNIIEAMNGRITVQSSANGISIFIVQWLL